jgi:hypothetical protein
MDTKTRMDQAQAIISNPVFTEAVSVLEKAYIGRMIDTAPTEVEERNKWHSCILSLNDVKTALTAFIQDGKIQIDNERKMEKSKHV